MTTINTKNLSLFGQTALELDSGFTQMQHLARDLESLSIETDSGLERAKKLLGQFEACTQAITDCSQAFSKVLQETKAATEKSAEMVAHRAQAVHERQVESEQMLYRFKTLGEMVRKTTEAVTQVVQPLPGTPAIPEEAHRVLMSRLPDFNEQMGVLVEEAKNLMQDAHKANMKSIERNADSLRQTLQAARHRLNLFAARRVPGTLTH